MGREAKVGLRHLGCGWRRDRDSRNQRRDRPSTHLAPVHDHLGNGRPSRAPPQYGRTRRSRRDRIHPLLDRQDVATNPILPAVGSRWRRTRSPKALRTSTQTGRLSCSLSPRLCRSASSLPERGQRHTGGRMTGTSTPPTSSTGLSSFADSSLRASTHSSPAPMRRSRRSFGRFGTSITGSKSRSGM